MTVLPRSKVTEISFNYPSVRPASNPSKSFGGDSVYKVGLSTSVLTRSEGHPVNRNTGRREGGGPFSMYRYGQFVNPGHVTNAYNPSQQYLYTGPVLMAFPLGTPIESNYKGFKGVKFDDSKLEADGATAIAQCAPINPTANVSTTIAEVFREGIPSLPGIQSWKKRTEVLRAAGSEYLNYQFGWAPLHSEVQNVTNAARHHRDILQNYRHNEGRNVRRQFDFPDVKTVQRESLGSAYPFVVALGSSWVPPVEDGPSSCTMSYETTRKRWFEGDFTYGGPSKLDSFKRALGFGSDADALFGTALSPDVLWNLTPWSWAVDWFTNAGDVIHNFTNFAAAGLVMRSGYMMEETIETLKLDWSGFKYWTMKSLGDPSKGALSGPRGGGGSRGYQVVTKTRVPANPFGFGVGWEGLSPTQLAITAAIGITRFLK
jgi:hypothetical protein